MKRAVLLFALLCGCGSSVTLGAFATVDGGISDMTCLDCDLPPFIQTDMWPPPSSDLGPTDFAFTFDMR